MTSTGDPTRLSAGALPAALGELDSGWAAQAHAALGFPVVPMRIAQPGNACTCRDPGCSDPGKHPRLRGWPWLAATVDPAVVGEWRWRERRAQRPTSHVSDGPGAVTTEIRWSNHLLAHQARLLERKAVRCP
jgi:hypothetical protein